MPVLSGASAPNAKSQGQNNAQRLFGITAIPTPNQLKNVLDGVAAKMRSPIFDWIYQALAAQGHWQADEVLDGQLLIGLDGTEYFSSASIHCQQCSHRTPKRAG